MGETTLTLKTDEDWAAYTSAGAIPRGRSHGHRALPTIGSGICADTELFRSTYVDGADARHEWNNLETAMSQVAE